MSLTLDDRVAIEVLCYRYNVAADERDADAYAACFTAEGVWDGPLGRFEGEAGLRELIAQLRASAALAGTRHWANNLVIDGDSATGVATVALDNLLVQASEEGPRLFSLSRSVGQVVREAGGWKFVERIVTPHAPPR